MKSSKQKQHPVFKALRESSAEIRLFMLKRLGCPHLADDLLQDLTERVLSRNTDNVSNPRSYLFQAANNAVIDYKRAEQTRNNYLADQEPHNQTDLDHHSPERINISHESINELQIALAQLSPLSQRIFQLYRLEGLTQKQIAKQLGISLSTVEKRLAKVFKHCRDHLSATGTYDF